MEPSRVVNRPLTSERIDLEGALSQSNMTKPQNDPTENPTGPRTYPDKPVSRPVQGPNSPGATEPGDMGASDSENSEQAPRENPGADGKSGYRGGSRT